MIYEVTVWVDDSRFDEWTEWMHREHIPDVMATRCFSSYSVIRLPKQDASGRRATRIQYVLKDGTAWNTYKESHAPRLQQAHAARYAENSHAERALVNQEGRQPL